MKRFLIALLALVLIVFCLLSGSLAETVRTDEYMRNSGFSVFQMDGLSDIGMDGSIFDGTAYTLCLCAYSSESKSSMFAWYSPIGGLFVAQSPSEQIFKNLDAVKTAQEMQRVYLDLCKRYFFDVCLYLKDGKFYFCLPRPSNELYALANRIGGKMIDSCVSDFDDYEAELSRLIGSA